MSFDIHAVLREYGYPQTYLSLALTRNHERRRILFDQSLVLLSASYYGLVEGVPVLVCDVPRMAHRVDRQTLVNTFKHYRAKEGAANV